MILYAYTFIPKEWDAKKKHPLVVFIHGGVHGSTLTGGPDNDGRLIRELVEQGYAVISPEYRGSTKVGADPELSGKIPIKLAQRPEQLRASLEANLLSLGMEQIPLVNLRRADVGPRTPGRGRPSRRA